MGQGFTALPLWQLICFCTGKTASTPSTPMTAINGSGIILEDLTGPPSLPAVCPGDDGVERTYSGVVCDGLGVEACIVAMALLTKDAKERLGIAGCYKAFKLSLVSTSQQYIQAVLGHIVKNSKPSDFYPDENAKMRLLCDLQMN